MSMEYIRRTYGVPAKRGGRVVYNAQGVQLHLTIISSRGAYLFLRNEETGARSGPYHPTDNIRYFDRGDHSAGASP